MNEAAQHAALLERHRRLQHAAARVVGSAWAGELWRLHRAEGIEAGRTRRQSV